MDWSAINQLFVKKIYISENIEKWHLHIVYSSTNISIIKNLVKILKEKQQKSSVKLERKLKSFLSID